MIPVPQSALRRIQLEHAEWAERNFGDTQNLTNSALGVCEEAGELAHAVLKINQSIRGSREEHREAAADALGDIFIFACGVATALGLDLEECIVRTWDQVSQRDWTAERQMRLDVEANGDNHPVLPQ